LKRYNKENPWEDDWMDAQRIFWNEQQQKLNQAVGKANAHAAAIELFMGQHAMVHAAQVTDLSVGSFEDEVWQGLSDAQARTVPAGFEHSIVWMLWHSARCEDITFNILVAGGEQVLVSGGWVEKMGIHVRDTGNTLDGDSLARFNAEIDIAALRGYRCETALQTREIVRAVAPGGFGQGIQPDRVTRILAEGAVAPEAHGLIDYWAGRSVGGLMLMPATRHHLVHINEAVKVKKKLTRG
jgi:hypothetical protein